jgi:hypothetical protein
VRISLDQVSSRTEAVRAGADWLQGPYLYSLYREQHDLSEQTTALLFVTGFCAGGVTAPLVGRFADERCVRRCKSAERPH